MNKEFVPFEEALALKKLGFNEVCFGFYDDISKQFFTVRTDGWSKKVNENASRAPLYQQAFRWITQFPQIKKSRYNIALYPDGTYSIKDGKESIHEYLSPEDCLRKLIEIVKEK